MQSFGTSWCPKAKGVSFTLNQRPKKGSWTISIKGAKGHENTAKGKPKYNGDCAFLGSKIMSNSVGIMSKLGILKLYQNSV